MNVLFESEDLRIPKLKSSQAVLEILPVRLKAAFTNMD